MLSKEVMPMSLGDKDGPEISLTKDYARAQGTFIIEGDKIYHPLNITTFECYRAWGYCSQADVDIDDKSGSTYYVNTTQMLLTIVSWNDEEVVANNEAICATTTRTINSKAKEVYQITRNNGQSCEPMCKPLAKPQISKLVSGFKISQAYYAEKRKVADGYRSKEYQAYLEALRDRSMPLRRPRHLCNRRLRPTPRHLRSNHRATELERLAQSSLVETTGGPWTRLRV